MNVKLCTALLVLACLGSGVAAAHDGAACQTDPPQRVVAARTALAASPASLDARFALADALIEANCYDAAVHALEDGEARHPRSAELQAKLRTTRSLASEQTYFAGLEQAEVAARVSRNLLRCTRLSDLNACDEALKLKPDDLDVLVAKGNAQLSAGRPADAETTYLRALQLLPGHPAANAQLAVARSRRQAALSTCKAGSDDGALAACQSALMRGADDEFAVHIRLAQLHQQRNQPAAALASYIAANRLRRGDRNVALGIVALTDADPHLDAVALAARGSAFLTLGRATDALTALKQARALAPAMPDLRTQIAQAEKLARSHQARPAATTGAPPSQVAQAAGESSKRYSNAAEPGRSN